MIDIRVQSADFDPGKQLERLSLTNPAAVVSLTILVAPQPGVAEILVDHYPAMAKEELGRIAEEAAQRWQLTGVVLLHRHGRLAIGDRISFVATAAADRAIAVEACDFLARETSRRAPFWRREVEVEEEVSGPTRRS